MMVLEKQAYTLDDLLAMGEDAYVEIIDWELVEMTAAGGVHQIISGNIFRILDRYVNEKDIGIVMPDQMTYLMNSVTKGLKDSFVPDVSYINRENVPKGWVIEKPHPGVPDLAVEIFSPGDNVEILLKKVETYLEKGTIQIWIIYPKVKELHQFTSEEPNKSRIYRGSETIDAKNLFPDIEGLTTDAIFHLPAWIISDDKAEE
ncbi:MAG: Uma2 family endonuclease [Anaerolineae bacterium]|nr:Uma2 family endonuclease [Anaerolineae bacterium]MDQ7035733.1 Uma2 family endonuclease [Anaerolineae bacterium]